MAIVNIGAREFTAGESYSDDLVTGGFSPDSYGLNLTYKIGALYFINDGTERGSSTLTDTIIASAYDNQNLGNDGYFVGDEGNFYTINGATFTKRQSSVVGSSADNFSFVNGNVDIIQFRGGDTFCTVDYGTGPGEIIKLSGSNITTIDSTWWTVTEGNSSLAAAVRRPLEAVEGTLFIGDGANIHTWDGTTSVQNAVQLPTGVNITSLRKHPDGRTLLAFAAETFNFSHTKGNGARVFYVDTVLSDWTREVKIQAQVEGTHLNGGVVYCTWGKNFGFFDGNGLVPLKRFETSSVTYSQNITSMEDTVLTRDGTFALAYGNLGQGNVFWRPWKNTVSSQEISNVFYKGDNVAMFSYDDGAGAGELFEIDFDNIGNNGAFYSNKIDPGGTFRVKRIEILHDETTTVTRFIEYYRDLTGAEKIIEDKTPGSAAKKTRIQCDVEADIFQLFHSPTNDDIGIYNIRIYYDPIK